MGRVGGAGRRGQAGRQVGVGVGAGWGGQGGVSYVQCSVSLLLLLPSSFKNVKSLPLIMF